MSQRGLLGELLDEKDPAVQKKILEKHAPHLDDQLANALRAKADRLLRSDLQRCLQICDLLLYAAELIQNPLHRALGLLAKANAYTIGLAEHERALELYDEAAAIYQSHNSLVDQAKSQIGKLWALASLGRYEEVMKIGEWAGQVLESQEEWFLLAKLTGNMGAIFGRIGEDAKALSLFDRALELYSLHGGSVGLIAGAEYNRAMVLRNLGRFDESIRASQTAIKMIGQTDQRIRAARARQSLATTYFLLGRLNEALELLEETKNTFLADGRQRDALLAELFISDCMLQLRRFADVLEKCSEIRAIFSELGTRFEVAQAILNEAVAYAGLSRYREARASLAEARHLFEREDNPVWMATTDLEQAHIFYYERDYEPSLVTAEACIGVFQAHGLPYWEALAKVIAARAATALKDHHHARQLVSEALKVGEDRDIPALTYQSHYLLGRLARSQDDHTDALAEYDLALQALERWRGRLMVEFRIGFLEDKEVIYEETVDLCLTMNRPLKGLEVAERAKSRALLDLLAHRLNLSIQPRKADDGPTVEELTRLRARRDQMLRRWESDEEVRGAGWYATRDDARKLERDVLVIEKQITDLWHKLLIRNADYARDATLWHVRIEPIQPYLDANTLLLEYFSVRDDLVVFLVTAEGVQARRLSVDLAQVQRLIRLLRLNLRLVPQSPPGQIIHLTANCQKLLQRLYRHLVYPVSDESSRYRQLVVVPHGPLHYLPFHALHDDECYLLERHEISYLPGSSLLRYCREAAPRSSGLLAAGCSCGGRLPYAVQEAEEVASIMVGQALLEEQATLSAFREATGNHRIVHLASHGDFRADNPLFSSLALADGWLTTLDVFNLRLDASLVTLSGCQTGRSVVGGGDELLGLMRAFLYAGTASLVLSQWVVEDQSTARLMRALYQGLAAGRTKAAALREAQLQFLEPEHRQEGKIAGFYHHPYFWAPFYLVGEADHL